MATTLQAHRKPAFNTRSFVAAAMVMAALALVPSGIANHVLAFDALTPARHLWMTVHNVAGILLCLFVSWHVILNWKALVNHVRKLAAQQIRVKWEAVAGGLLVIAIILGATVHVFLLQ